MASYNKVILMGNLTRKPEVRYTQSGTAICKFGLAVNRRFKDQSGEWKEEPTFIDITFFGKRGEAFAKYQDYDQFKLRRPDMTLAEFKLIYFWEWFHRVWGRLIGLAVALPFLAFWMARRMAFVAATVPMPLCASTRASDGLSLTTSQGASVSTSPSAKRSRYRCSFFTPCPWPGWKRSSEKTSAPPKISASSSGSPIARNSW